MAFASGADDDCYRTVEHLDILMASENCIKGQAVA